MLVFANLNRLRNQIDLTGRQLSQLRYCKAELDRLLPRAALDPVLAGQIFWQQKELEQLERAISRRRLFLEDAEHRVWNLRESIREQVDSALQTTSSIL